jgi:hypothetical protein
MQGILVEAAGAELAGEEDHAGTQLVGKDRAGEDLVGEDLVGLAPPRGGGCRHWFRLGRSQRSHLGSRLGQPLCASSASLDALGLACGAGERLRVRLVVLPPITIAVALGHRYCFVASAIAM